MNEEMVRDETCVLVKLPVVVGEDTAQIVVDNVFHIKEGAIKVERIDATIREIDFDIIDDKVVIRGVLHKQIFFVGRDNIVRHQAENVPFSGDVRIPGARPDMDVQFRAVIREPVRFELLRRSRVRQVVVIEVFVKVARIEQLPIPFLGSIQGTVTKDGAAVPFAFILVFDDQWRFIKFVFTNLQGRYRVINLSPGRYFMVAVHPLFKPKHFEVKEVEVAECHVTIVNFFDMPVPFERLPLIIQKLIIELRLKHKKPFYDEDDDDNDIFFSEGLSNKKDK